MEFCINLLSAAQTGFVSFFLFFCKHNCNSVTEQQLCIKETNVINFNIKVTDENIMKFNV